MDHRRLEIHPRWQRAIFCGNILLHTLLLKVDYLNMDTNKHTTVLEEVFLLLCIVLIDEAEDRSKGFPFWEFPYGVECLK